MTRSNVLSLFEARVRKRRAPWAGRLDVVALPRDLCPDCGFVLHVAAGADARALFWLHGYGAIVRVTFVSCVCGYRRHWRTETITPRMTT